MQTVTIDIINEHAIHLLHDLELMNLIHVHSETNPTQGTENTNWAVRYKGAMSKQPLSEIDNQLNELRSGWE